MSITKRDRTLLFILLAAVIGVALVVFFGGRILRGGAAPEEIKFPPVPSVDAGLFNDPRFKALVAPRGLPVEAGKTGNTNPFSSESNKQKTETAGGLQFNKMEVTPEMMKIPDESFIPEEGIPWEMIEGTPQL